MMSRGPRNRAILLTRHDGPVRYEPMSPERLTDHLADEIAARAKTGERLRVAVDGPPAAGPTTLAAALAGPLRLRGHAAFGVDTSGFLRPASLRF